MSSVSHAKHGQIREICEICVPYYLENFVCQDCMRILKHTDLTDHTDFLAYGLL